MDSQILMLEILQILREVCLDQQINKKIYPTDRLTYQVTWVMLAILQIQKF